MEQTLGDFLVNHHTCDLTDLEDTFDTIEYIGRTVCEDEYDEHRWYINYRVVKKFMIEGFDRYFSYINCKPKDENADKEDYGWEIPHPDDMIEVFPEEIRKIVYR